MNTIAIGLDSPARTSPSLVERLARFLGLEFAWQKWKEDSAEVIGTGSYDTAVPIYANDNLQNSGPPMMLDLVQLRMNYATVRLSHGTVVNVRNDYDYSEYLRAGDRIPVEFRISRHDDSRVEARIARKQLQAA